MGQLMIWQEKIPALGPLGQIHSNLWAGRAPLPQDLICLAANYICAGIMLYIVQLYGNKIGLPQVPLNSSLSLRGRSLSGPYVRGPVLFPDDPRKVWDLISLQAEASSNLIQPRGQSQGRRFPLPSILHKPAKG